jgi:hypothetical protein
LLALKDAIAGQVVLPDSASYHEMRRPQIRNFDDVRPGAIVLRRAPGAGRRAPGDVAEALSLARQAGTAVAVRPATAQGSQAGVPARLAARRHPHGQEPSLTRDLGSYK